MADHTIAIANTMGIVGPGPTSKWGEMVWGTDNWGSGSRDLSVAVEKLLTNAITPSDAIVAKEIMHVITNTLSPTGDLSSQTLQDRNGYYYVFVRPSTNAEDRDASTFTAAAAASTTWTSAAVSAAVWS